MKTLPESSFRLYIVSPFVMQCISYFELMSSFILLTILEKYYYFHFTKKNRVCKTSHTAGRKTQTNLDCNPAFPGQRACAFHSKTPAPPWVTCLNLQCTNSSQQHPAVREWGSCRHGMYLLLNEQTPFCGFRVTSLPTGPQISIWPCQSFLGNGPRLA